MITRTPECRHPRIAPPRASTKNEIKKLKKFNFKLNKIYKITCKKKNIEIIKLNFQLLQKKFT